VHFVRLIGVPGLDFGSATVATEGMGTDTIHKGSYSRREELDRISGDQPLFTETQAGKGLADAQAMRAAKKMRCRMVAYLVEMRHQGIGSKEGGERWSISRAAKAF
jgi:hypothetical protein